MRRVRRRKRPLDYVLPFLVLISVGIIGVMGFQVWQSWGNEGGYDVHFYVADGKAKVLPYSQVTWDNAFSGTKLLLGDALKTSPSGKVVVEFFNSTKVRLDGDTAITLTDVSKGGSTEKIVLNLDNGSVWVNGEKSPGVRNAYYEVRTASLLVKATGTVFEVESGATQVIRVFDGDVKVDVLVSTNGQERVADTIDVGVGQEITIDDATLRAFEDNKSPSVLSAVGDGFKSGSWYKWNVSEDERPTDFSTYSGHLASSFSDDLIDESDATQDTLETIETSEDSSTQETTESDEDSLDDEADTINNGVDLVAPVITSPTETTIDKGSFMLAGTVGKGTEKVIVNSVLGDYDLSKFKNGDTSWSYNVSDEFGNLKSGDNIYKVYAVDEEGNKSDAAKITVTYNKKVVTLDEALVDPKVVSFNGGSDSIVDTNVVTVVGSVEGAEKVIVNGYTLSKFSAGATEWRYVASEAAGNLTSGVNEYEVYAVDPDGNKSSVVKFTVTYNKNESSSDTQQSGQSSDSDDSKVDESAINYGF